MLVFVWKLEAGVRGGVIGKWRWLRERLFGRLAVAMGWRLRVGVGVGTGVVQVASENESGGMNLKGRRGGADMVVVVCGQEMTRYQSWGKYFD